MSEKKLIEALKGLPLTQKSTCLCGTQTTLPLLWNDYYCTTCGRHFELPADDTRAVARRLVTALGAHPERIGLAMGDPQTLPSAFLQQLRAEVGRNFAFVRLDGKFRFECLHCGKCCKHSFKIKKRYFANLSVEESQRIFGDDTHNRLPLAEDSQACLFWGVATKRCLIHHKRPTFCRLFPLQSLGMDIDGERLRYLTWIPSPCPGVGMGKTWTVHEFLKVSGVLQQFT